MALSRVAPPLNLRQKWRDSSPEMRLALSILLASSLALPALAQIDSTPPPTMNREGAKGFTPAYTAALRDATRAFSRRDFEEAAKAVDRAEAMYRPTSVTLNMRGAMAIEQRDFERGRKFCLEALKENPSYLAARFNLAEIPFVQGRYADARAQFELLLKDDPSDELVQFRIFLTYLLQKDDNAARERLEKIPFLSKTPVFYYSHAAWEFAHGNKEEALKWVERGNWVFPPVKTQNYADVFYDLGWLQRPKASGD